MLKRLKSLEKQLEFHRKRWLALYARSSSSAEVFVHFTAAQTEKPFYIMLTPTESRPSRRPSVRPSSRPSLRSWSRIRPRAGRSQAQQH